MVDAEPFGKQTILRFHHVEVAVAREFCMQPVAGLARFAVTDSVRKNDEKLRRVERLTFPKQLIRKFRSGDELRAAASRPVHDEDCIRRFALCVLLLFSNGPIVETQLRQGLTGSELEVVNDIIAFRRRGIIGAEHVARGNDQ